jgi:hypothetical protein
LQEAGQVSGGDDPVFADDCEYFEGETHNVKRGRLRRLGMTMKAEFKNKLGGVRLQEAD